MTSPLPASVSVSRVAFASFVGTTIEWYGFFLYSSAALFGVFNSFFPKTDPTSVFLGVAVVYVVGFVGRPLGGLVFGHFGDRLGRKAVLVYTLTISGTATFLIGLLPSYKSIGIGAPILLVILRIAQGFGVGGEWGPAVLMAVEHAGDKRRGFYGSWPQAGVPVGLLLSTIAFAVIPNAALLDWGWRIPFLLSIALVGVGLYFRKSIPETPPFDAIEPESRSTSPIRDTFQQHRRNVFLAMGAKIAENGTFYLYTSFMLVLASERAKTNWNLQLYSRNQVLIAVSIAAVILVGGLLIYGWLSDLHRIGRKRVYLFGAIFTAVFAIPSFIMIQSGSLYLMTLAVVGALVLGWGAMYAPQASLFAELFDTRVRNTGASIAAQVATIFAGGIAPSVAEAILGNWLTTLPIAPYLIAMAILTTICVFLLPETHRKSIIAEKR